MIPSTSSCSAASASLPSLQTFTIILPQAVPVHTTRVMDIHWSRASQTHSVASSLPTAPFELVAPCTLVLGIAQKSTLDQVLFGPEMSRGGKSFHLSVTSPSSSWCATGPRIPSRTASGTSITVWEPLY